jgi:hypothetical protein
MASPSLPLELPPIGWQHFGRQGNRPERGQRGGTRSESAVEDVKGRSGKGHILKSKTEELRRVVAFVRIAFAVKLSN